MAKHRLLIHSGSAVGAQTEALKLQGDIISRKDWEGGADCDFGFRIPGFAAEATRFTHQQIREKERALKLT